MRLINDVVFFCTWLCEVQDGAGVRILPVLLRNRTPMFTHDEFHPHSENKAPTPLRYSHLSSFFFCECANIRQQVFKSLSIYQPSVTMVTEGCLKAITPYLCLDHWMRRKWTLEKNERRTALAASQVKNKWREKGMMLQPVIYFSLCESDMGRKKEKRQSGEVEDSSLQTCAGSGGDVGCSPARSPLSLVAVHNDVLLTALPPELHSKVMLHLYRNKQTGHTQKQYSHSLIENKKLEKPTGCNSSRQWWGKLQPTLCDNRDQNKKSHFMLDL